MNLDETILIFDYPEKGRRKRNIISILMYALFFVILVLFGSYTNTTYRSEGKLLELNSVHFQSVFQNQSYAIDSLYLIDTTYNLNTQINDLLVKFYELRNFSPAWTEGNSVNKDFVLYLNLLDSINYYGFPIDYFNKDEIKHLRKNFEDKNIGIDPINNRINLELVTSFSAFKLMIFLNRGIIDKDSSMAYFNFIETLPGLLNDALNQQLVENKILSVQPDLLIYKDILNSIPYFIDLHRSVRNTTPKFIDDNLLAKSLFYAGITESPVFDSLNRKNEAIYKLEKHYGLPLDSILNVNTHKVLVSLLDFRYYQACLNLHRLRKLGDINENYLFVNIPEFKMYVVESNIERDTFNVIVGSKRTPTPSLSSSIEKIITNPYWTVPRRIALNEMVRKIRKDSTYLKRNGYFIIDNYENIVNDSVIDWKKPDPLGSKYWIRQKNSTINALGQVKFVFQNDYQVYIHDTPNKSLFSKEQRDFSHGCVRLENPGKLAQYLSDRFQSKNKNNIRNMISTQMQYEIELSEKVDIHVQYITCLGSNHSEIKFLRDIYNLDKSDIMAIFPGHSGI